MEGYGFNRRDIGEVRDSLYTGELKLDKLVGRVSVSAW